MATLKVGSARIDENGAAVGGVAGDQTGAEVSTQSYYLHSKGWYLLRPIEISIADAIAEAMQQACDNANIGYDQGNRLGVITQLQKYGTMKKIAVKTECDCSSLVRGCCIQAGIKDPGNFTTANEVTKLEATGAFEKKVAVTSSTKLYNGDILVTKTKGHTVVVTSGSPRGNNSNATTETAKAESAKYKSASLKGKYVTTTDLNLRAGAGTDKAKLTVMPKGATVTCYGYYNKVSDGTKWLYVVFVDKNGKSYTGYASSKYLKAEA